MEVGGAAEAIVRQKRPPAGEWSYGSRVGAAAALRA
jgi:hypothetical protein